MLIPEQSGQVRMGKGVKDPACGHLAPLVHVVLPDPVGTPLVPDAHVRRPVYGHLVKVVDGSEQEGGSSLGLGNVVFAAWVPVALQAVDDMQVWKFLLELGNLAGVVSHALSRNGAVNPWGQPPVIRAADGRQAEGPGGHRVVAQGGVSVGEVGVGVAVHKLYHGSLLCPMRA